MVRQLQLISKITGVLLYPGCPGHTAKQTQTGIGTLEHLFDQCEKRVSCQRADTSPNNWFVQNQILSL